MLIVAHDKLAVYSKSSAYKSIIFYFIFTYL